jgi:bifunctional non-homologous end joining protein LigD
VRIYSQDAYGWTVRLAAIAAKLIRAKRDGEAIVLGPDELSRFDELRRRKAAIAAILYAFDLIEHDGKDLPDRPFLNRKAALARLLPETEAGIVFSEHIAEDSHTVFAHAWLGAEGHRVEEGRRYLSIGPVLGLGKGPQSRQHRRTARAERDLE